MARKKNREQLFLCRNTKCNWTATAPEDAEIPEQCPDCGSADVTAGTVRLGAYASAIFKQMHGDS